MTKNSRYYGAEFIKGTKTSKKIYSKKMELRWESIDLQLHLLNGEK